jgi:DNA-directed RNA polymerase specialized sigma24 family protein
MLFQKRDPVELLDQMYTMAFWMSGSVKKIFDLVHKTYERIDSHTSDIAMFRAFRNVFKDEIAKEAPPAQPEPSPGKSTATIRSQEADIKLAVLLVEICALHHKEISIIMGHPIVTIRLWLSSGRKALLKSGMGWAPPPAFGEA